jgi:hypothetical protein
MPRLHANLELPRCPHCRIDHPNLGQEHSFHTRDHSNRAVRFWKTYVCARCGGVALAASREDNGEMSELYPSAMTVEDALPERARTFLQQAIDSVHAPSGAVMLAASAIDSMLKAKNYRDGSLFTRIGEAQQAGLITADMAAWAHDVRLDANDQRHADDTGPLPTEADASRVIDFAQALGQLLFVLPARVQRGRAAAGQQPSAL